MIGTLLKFTIKNFFGIVEMSRLVIKGDTLYIHYFRKAVGSTIWVLFLIFDWFYWPFNAAAIAYFSCFDNNLFSVITPLAFDNDNVSLIQIFKLHTWTCLPFLLFSATKSKGNFYIKSFIENQLPVKSNQIDVSIAVRSMRYSKNRR